MAEYVQARINEGAWVVVADLNHDNGRRVAEEIRKSGGRSLAIETDVSRPESESAMPAETLLAFQRIDILVNNAAIFPASLEEWDLALRINLWGTFYCCRAGMSNAIDTPQPKDHVASEEQFCAKAKRIPVGIVVQPEDLVRPVVFLASGWSSYITNQTLLVNGGSIMW